MNRKSATITVCLVLLLGGVYYGISSYLKAERAKLAQERWEERVAELKALGFDYSLVNHVIALDAQQTGKRLLDDPWLGERMHENAPHKLPDFHSHLKGGTSLASASMKTWRESHEMPEQTERLALFQHAKEQYLKNQAEITLAQKAIDNADSVGILSKYNPLTTKSTQTQAFSSISINYGEPHLRLHLLFLNLSRIEIELGSFEQSLAYLSIAQKHRRILITQSHSLISLQLNIVLALEESKYLIYLSTNKQATQFESSLQSTNEIDLPTLLYNVFMTEVRSISSSILDLETFNLLEGPLPSSRYELSRIFLGLFDPILPHNHTENSFLTPIVFEKQKILAHDSSYSKAAKEYMEGLAQTLKGFETYTIYSQATVDIANLSIACNLFHREHGSYPQSLAELVPGYLSDLPTIPYTQEAYTYELRPDQRPLIQATLQSDLEASSDGFYQSTLLD